MLIFNNTTSSSSSFLLTAFPGLELMHVWICISVCCLYTVALLGNSLILVIIVTERSLHKPMYYFLSMLSVVDLCLTITTLPTVLGVLWFHAPEISIKACLIQMFLVHTFSFLESSVLVAMAFDRFMAICNALQYAVVLTDMMSLVIALTVFLRQVVFFFPCVLALISVPFHGGHELSHPFCYHPDVIKFVYYNAWLTNFGGMFLQLYLNGTDLLFILFSYILILRTALNIVTPKKQQKALSTCVCHISHRLFSSTPRVICSILANIYLLLPPVLNPIIYSLKIKVIRQAMMQLLQFKSLRGTKVRRLWGRWKRRGITSST
uniref:Olfactory receptor n=1 Tax=Cavia porcellus TaxID=10141 RepID=A0A286XS48_CAVPO